MIFQEIKKKRKKNPNILSHSDLSSRKVPEEKRDYMFHSDFVHGTETLILGYFLFYV